METYRVIIIIVFLAALIYTSITSPKEPPQTDQLVEQMGNNATWP